jgi:fatty acid desaturase
MQQLDHKAVIAGIPDEVKAALTEKSDYPGLVRLAGHFTVLVAGGLYIGLQMPGWAWLLPLHGFVLTFLFTTLHETIHRTTFKTKWINDRVASLCGFLGFLPAGWFRYFHFAHHRYTHDPDHDPELQTPKPLNLRNHLVYLSGIPEWIARFSGLIKNATKLCMDSFVPSSARAEVQSEARWHIMVYGLLLLGSLVAQSTILFWVWLLPSLVGNPFLRLYLLAEHGLCPNVRNMLENTRTVYTNSFVRFFAWNMPYHIEHHCYPGIPFHKLPDFHKVLREHLVNTSDGYIEFNREYFKALNKGNR